MKTYELLGLISGLLLIPVYWSYYLQTRKGESVPNPATWLIWVVVMLFNGATYTIMVDNWLEGFISITAPILLLTSFIYFLTRRKFTKLGRTESIILMLTFLIGIVWKLTNATVSNLCLQAILAFSFWPTIKGLLWGDNKEKPLPWLIAVVAYGFTITANVINFNGDYAKLIFPLINGVIGNGSVAVIAIIKNRK